MRNKTWCDDFLQKVILGRAGPGEVPATSRRGALVRQAGSPGENCRDASLRLESYLGQFRRAGRRMKTAEYRSPSGPKAVPGIYQVRLTVDGQTQNQPLKVIMDPRSPATPEVLAQQLQLGQQIFAETIAARRALAEIVSVQKQLTEIQKKLVQEKSETQNAQLKSAISEAQSAIGKILRIRTLAEEGPGLQDVYNALVSALRVVESGDRAVPSQAIAVYKESSQPAKARIAEWTDSSKCAWRNSIND